MYAVAVLFESSGRCAARSTKSVRRGARTVDHNGKMDEAAVLPDRSKTRGRAVDERQTVGGRARTQKDIDRAVQRDSYSEPGNTSTEQRWVTVVIALKAADFDQWCKENGKNPRDRNFLMATPATVRGLQNARVEITPRGMWRADIRELMAALVPVSDRPSQKRLQEMGWGLPVP